MSSQYEELQYRVLALESLKTSVIDPKGVSHEFHLMYGTSIRWKSGNLIQFMDTKLMIL